MISLMRGGPRLLLIETKNGDELGRFLDRKLADHAYDLGEAWKKAGEQQTLVFVKDMTGKEDGDSGSWLEDCRIFVLSETTEDLLCALVNERLCGLVDRVESRPGGLIVRTFGEVDAIVDLLKDELGAQEIEGSNLASCPAQQGTTVLFTEKPLGKILEPSDLHPRRVVLPMRNETALRLMRRGIVRYVTSGLSKRSWNSVELRLYDKYGLYDLHYRRVMRVLEALELGLVVGEGWSRDFARVLLELKCYSLKMVTPIEPSEVKRILVGLEYAANGHRIMDLDLHLGKQKISWGELAAGETRESLGLKARNGLRARLEPADRDELDALEAEILSKNW
ncbi:MAG: hypothetical protein ACC613_01705 [Synergistales bacterium]|jgi:hypothetical protein